jgi:ribosome-associated translation inhibitor RaiA
MINIFDLTTDELKRRLIKYKDRIIEMHLKHEHLHVPVRRAE